MNQNDKVEIGKNGLRSYQFETVKKDKTISHYERDIGRWTEHHAGMFYTKQCVYCSKEFEARRVDTAFRSQNCQKAHLRLREIIAKNYRPHINLSQQTINHSIFRLRILK